MTCFLTFSVNAVRVASDIPAQSDYVPVMTQYFFVSILYTLISMFWFALINYYSTNGYLPKYLYRLVETIQELKKAQSAYALNGSHLSFY